MFHICFAPFMTSVITTLFLSSLTRDDYVLFDAYNRLQDLSPLCKLLWLPLLLVQSQDRSSFGIVFDVRDRRLPNTPLESSCSDSLSQFLAITPISALRVRAAENVCRAPPHID